ncbi:MAG TPA: hypothetical protein VFP98_03185, partial [Candidatus Polarisedimenticolia bacterium]|nr:hypothetical protein [Candidatus Polarisedimenticolia bacterium]
QIYHSQTGLFAYDRSAGRETLLLDSPAGEPWGPAYSPDGSSIAYTRIDTAGPWDIHVMPAGGGTPRRLTSGSESALWPRWSPDGSQIAYCTFGKGDDDLFVVPAEGGAARQLTRGGGDDWWPSWSPDGTEIVFSRTDAGSTRLYRVRLAGGPPELLRDQSATLPHHSRDGALLAVAGDRGFWHGVGVMPSAGGPIRWLTDTGGWPVFRPDGRAVGFVRLDPGGRQSLWEVAVEGGEAYPIDGPEFSSWNYPFAYHPRGDGLVYSRSTGMEGDLWMIELPP